MTKIIHILPHNIEDFMAGDYTNFDHHSTRFLAKVKYFWQKTNNNEALAQELWILSKILKQPQEFQHQNGFLVRTFPISLKLPLPLEISFSLLKQVKKYQSQEPIIWHLHSYYLLMNSLLAVKLKRKKQKFVMHFRGGGPSFTLKAFWYTCLQYLFTLRIALNLASYVFVQNHTEEKRVLNFLGVKKEKVVYFPNSVAENQIASENSLSQNIPQTIKLIIAGRIEKITHKPKMVKILEKILSQNQKLNLEIIGLKNQNQLLENLKQKFPLRITLFSWLIKSQLLEKFKQGDIFMHVNAKEGFEGSPMTLIEAQSQGLLAIACDIAGVRDVIKDSFNGYLVKQIADISAKISELCQNPQKIAQLKKNSLKNIRNNFTDEKYFPQLIKIYSTLLAG